MDTTMFPQMLYHYTSIEKLALILKNRTIRLNPLDKMDDLQEQKTADIKNLGKFIFVSSWTEDSRESIPMWKMYTDSTAGVRIGLPPNPFIWHGTTGKSLSEAINAIPTDNLTKEGVLPTFLDLSVLMKRGIFSVQAYNGQILEPVKYIDDIEKLEPHVLHLDGDKLQLKTGLLGRNKSTYWAFQHEWRYIMTFFSVDFSGGVDSIANSFTINANKMAEGTLPPPIDFWDLSIDPQHFSEMEIMCSPQITSGNRVILESLVEKYNCGIKITDSELMGKI